MIKVSNCTILEFKEKIREKKIVCFCAGQNFYNFCESFQVTEKILCVVDNFRFGTSIEVGKYRIPVISMDDLRKELKECIWVVTTVKFADELVQQLDSNDICHDQEVYFPELFINDVGNKILSLDGVCKIPKHIHYFWFGHNEMPDTFKRNIETWHKYCPDYEITCWNEDNYDIAKNKYMKQAYEAKKWGFVPDYARLDVIYTYGGIYLDTDVEVVRSLDELLKCDMFCGFESSLNVNFGQGFGAVKQHPVIKKMMDLYDELEFKNAEGTLNLIPSPIYQTRSLCELGLKKDGKIQKVRGAIILSTEYLSPINEHGYGKIGANTYAIHHYAGSWYNAEQECEKKRIVGNYNYLLSRIDK